MLTPRQETMAGYQERIDTLKGVVRGSSDEKKEKAEKELKEIQKEFRELAEGSL